MSIEGDHTSPDVGDSEPGPGVSAGGCAGGSAGDFSEQGILVPHDGAKHSVDEGWGLVGGQ